MKGMQKISRGKGFEGVLKYAFERDTPFAEPGQLIGGNMSGMTIEELTREFGLVHSLRPDIEKPVWHNSLRLPKGESLNSVKWSQIAEDYLDRMGFSKLSPYVVVLHDDKEGQHIHIIASRVSFDRSVYLGRNENLISTRIISELEKDQNLTITKGLEYDENNKIVKKASKSKVKRGELEQAVRTGEAPVRLRLQAMVDLAKKGKPKPSVLAFIERLEAQGVNVVPNLASTGKLNGFSFELDGIAFKASQLGAAYSWTKLQKEVKYEQDRDFDELRNRRAQASKQASPECERESETDAEFSRDIESAISSDHSVYARSSERVVQDDTNDATSIERSSSDSRSAESSNQRSDAEHSNTSSSEYEHRIDRDASSSAGLEYSDKSESERKARRREDENTETIRVESNEFRNSYTDAEQLDSTRAISDETDKNVAHYNVNNSDISNNSIGFDEYLHIQGPSTKPNTTNSKPTVARERENGKRHGDAEDLAKSNAEGERLNAQNIRQRAREEEVMQSLLQYVQYQSVYVIKCYNSPALLLTQEDWKKASYPPEEFKYISEPPPPHTYVKDKYAEFLDYGDRLIFSSTSDVVGAASRAVAAAKLKGWEGMTIEGSDAFKDAVFTAAREQGFDGAINGVFATKNNTPELKF